MSICTEYSFALNDSKNVIYFEFTPLEAFGIMRITDDTGKKVVFETRMELRDVLMMMECLKRLKQDLKELSKN